jgi:hypothetical protein
MFKNIKHNFIGLLIEIVFASGLIVLGLFLSYLFGLAK